MARAYVEIPLNGKKAAGRVTLVDVDDYALVICYRWFVMEHTRCGRTNGPYAYASVARHTIMMHKLLTGFSRTDHWNLDGLDNRRSSNLRDGSGSRNRQNSRRHLNGSSRFKGVRWDKANRRWRACVWINKRAVNLGSFTDEELAAHAYDEAAAVAFGEYALLNFPKED